MLACKMKTKQGGFTLVELMFTIMVLGVLLGLAVPNFRNFLRNSNLTTSANELLADLNFARTEAIKRRTIVSICSTANPEDADPACRAPDGDNFSGPGLCSWTTPPRALRTQAISTALGTLVKKFSVAETRPRGDRQIERRGDGFVREHRFPASGLHGNESATRVFMCDDRGNTKISGEDWPRGR